MVDPLHFLGVTKIHNFISMSDMKYNAIVSTGIKIVNRVEIPPDMVPVSLLRLLDIVHFALTAFECWNPRMMPRSKSLLKSSTVTMPVKPTRTSERMN